MAEPLVLGRREAFDFVAPRASPSGGVTASVRTGLGLASISAPKKAEPELAASVRSAFGIALPHGSEMAAAGGLTLLGVGPGAWLAVTEDPRSGWPASLVSKLGQFAAVVDQSGAYGVLRLGGPRVRDLLAKGVAIDLHPSVFTPGSVAATSLSHFNVVLWWSEAEDGFSLAVGRSVARDLWGWIEHSASEYGLSVQG